jgi:hypothetical protein
MTIIVKVGEHRSPESCGAKRVMAEFAPLAKPKFSLQIRGHFIDSGLRAFVVPAWRPGYADRSDHLIADLDRQTAGYRKQTT